MVDQPGTETGATDDVMAVRRAKIVALRDAGIEPFRDGYEPSDRVADIIARYAHLEPGAETDDVVTIAGRVIAKRDQGKALFLVVRDGAAELQAFCRLNVLGEEQFAFAADVDLGDWVGVSGQVLRTRRGELSVSPTRVDVLSKSLRPLPEKYHGLSDTETRYRQRYVDLIANPEVRSVFEARFRIIAAIRRFMEQRGFLEVETPMLQPIPGGATARPFVTHHNALDMDLYLRIAPELYLKRLLVGGFERVYEVNRSFRNEGMSPRHNPEFTMLEAYQAYGTMETMRELTESLVTSVAEEALGTLEIQYQGVEVSLRSPWRQATMSSLVSEAIGSAVSVHTPLVELRRLCDEHDVPIETVWGPGKLLTELFEKLVEHTLIQPTFVTHYPAEVSPLARRNDADPEITDRFELMITGREFANAFSELIDPIDQRGRFQAQAAAKDAGDDEAMWVDEDYLRAQEYGMPPAGGLGIGIDRLVMLLTDSASIRDVLLFPHMRPES
ncbi:MAG: lysine--tRNA ligase [Coriobacteriia bacterium]|nr:lysine--tRNA ligase [Coriobacteriia bacterium]MBN2839929.1 lysine--tRNA ligase [Coriobacteriia bacterium]